MATLPCFAWGPKSVMNMKYMLPEEGVRRLEQELEAGCPTARYCTPLAISIRCSTRR